MTWFKRANTPDPATTPTRALDTAFTPSTTKFVWCVYTIQCVGAAGTSTTVELRSDEAATPTTVRCSAMLAVTGAGDSDTVRGLLVYLCPPNHTIKLVSAGSGVLTVPHQTEVATC